MQSLIYERPFHSIDISKYRINIWNNSMDPWFYSTEIGLLTDHSVGTNKIMSAQLADKDVVSYVLDRTYRNGRTYRDVRYFFSFAGVRYLFEQSSKVDRKELYDKLISIILNMRESEIRGFTDLYIHRKFKRDGGSKW